MLQRLSFAASAALLLAGCADISPVALEMPVSRMEIPERTAGIVHVATGVGGQTYLVLTRDQVTTPPDPAHPQLDSCPRAVDGHGTLYDSSNDHCSGGLFFRGDAQLGDYVQVGLRRSFDELLVGQVKAYLLGPLPGQAKPGDNSLAATIGYGGDSVSTQGSNDNTGQNGKTDLDRHLVDFGLIYGHRWQKWLLSYAGMYYTHSDYSGTFTTGSSSRDFDGGAHMLGFNVGLKFDFGTPIVGGILECATAHISSGALSESRNRCAAGIEVTFAGLKHPQPQPRPEPRPAPQQPARRKNP